MVVDHINVAGYSSFAEKGLINDFAPSVKGAQAEYNIKNEIVKLYNNECPSIKHISENAVEKIRVLNDEYGAVLSIRDINNRFKKLVKNMRFFNSHLILILLII